TGVAMLDAGLEGGLHGRGVARVDQVEAVASGPFIGAIAQKALDRRTEVANGGIDREHRDQVVGMLNQRPPVLLAVLEGLLGELALSDVDAGADDVLDHSVVVADERRRPGEVKALTATRGPTRLVGRRGVPGGELVEYSSDRTRLFRVGPQLPEKAPANLL